MTAPVFLFSVDPKIDQARLVVLETGRRRTFDLDADLFDICPKRTLPTEFAGHEELYAASIKTFESLSPWNRNWLGRAERVREVHPHVS